MRRFSKTATYILSLSVLAACGRFSAAPSLAPAVPSVDESGVETADPVVKRETPITLEPPSQPPQPQPRPPQRKEPSDPTKVTSRHPLFRPAPKVIAVELKVSQVTNVRYEKDGVLEWITDLPAGSRLEITPPYQIKTLDYRTKDGKRERSSTGFVGPIRILEADGLTAERIAELNATSGGLFVTASLVAAEQSTSGQFPALEGGADGEDYLKAYEPSGRPRTAYSKKLQSRFGNKLNQVATNLNKIDLSQGRRIFEELQRAADRTQATDKSYLMTDFSKATLMSEAFEKSGEISQRGAWTIAVRVTSKRHGFANVPCAEFMSEMIRQAYARAGLRVTDEFNKVRKNELIWHKSASVARLSKALATAGWGVFDATKFRPPTGAILMHTNGLSPGHTYMAAGHEGRLILDNGSPQGRDLRRTGARTLNLMYLSGVFFLPPGIAPQPW